jgi:hypothetical protein
VGLFYAYLISSYDRLLLLVVHDFTRSDILDISTNFINGTHITVLLGGLLYTYRLFITLLVWSGNVLVPGTDKLCPRTLPVAATA